MVKQKTSHILPLFTRLKESLVDWWTFGWWSNTYFDSSLMSGWLFCWWRFSSTSSFLLWQERLSNKEISMNPMKHQPEWEYVFNFDSWFIIWLVVWLPFFEFSHILGSSSSQLTFIFFRGVAQPPTSYSIWLISISNQVQKGYMTIGRFLGHDGWTLHLGSPWGCPP